MFKIAENGQILLAADTLILGGKYETAAIQRPMEIDFCMKPMLNEA